MTKTETAFLYILRAVLHEEKPVDPGLTGEEWAALLRLAETHKLLPLILDAACGLPSYRNTAAPVRTVAARPESLPIEGKASAQPTDELAERQPAASAQQNKPETPYQAARRKDGARSSAPPAWKEMALEQAARQAIQENEFLNLILALQKQGLDPVVMKGPVCRNLYPRPLLRPSVDDDLLIADDQVAAYHAALLAFGMTADDPDANLDKAWELSYHKPNSPLYIELHKRLFDPDSAAFEDFNAPFEGALERAVPVTIQDVTLKTLAPTDHLLFLNIDKLILLANHDENLMNKCIMPTITEGMKNTKWRLILPPCGASATPIAASASPRRSTGSVRSTWICPSRSHLP